MSEVKLYKGDCLVEMKKIEDNSVDLILTDPPYIISRETNFNKGGGNESKYGSLSMDFGDWDKKPLDIKLLKHRNYIFGCLAVPEGREVRKSDYLTLGI